MTNCGSVQNDLRHPTRHRQTHWQHDNVCLQQHHLYFVPADSKLCRVSSPVLWRYNNLHMVLATSLDHALPSSAHVRKNVYYRAPNVNSHVFGFSKNERKRQTRRPARAVLQTTPTQAISSAFNYQSIEVILFLKLSFLFQFFNSLCIHWMNMCSCFNNALTSGTRNLCKCASLR